MAEVQQPIFRTLTFRGRKSERGPEIIKAYSGLSNV